MPSLALDVLLPDLANYIGLYKTVATTTNIGAGATVISTAWRDLGFTNDDALNGLWVRIRGTNNDREPRVIDDYTGSTGTVTVRGVNLASESGIKNVDLYPCDPEVLIKALNDARSLIRKWVYKETSYVLPTVRGGSRTFKLPDGLFIGRPSLVRLIGLNRADAENENLIQDRDPEFDTVDGTYWIATNMTTRTAVTSSSSPFDPAVLLSDSAGDFLTNGGSSAATVLNTVQQTVRGRAMGFEVWVYSLTSGRLTIRIDQDGSATNSAAHQGFGWERMQLRANIGASPSAVKVGIADAANTSTLRYFADKAFVVRGPLESVEYRTYNHLTDYEYIEPEGTATDGHLVFKTRLPQQMAIEVVGKTALSSVSAEADTMELDREQAILLYAAAVRQLPQSQAKYLATAEIDYDELQAKAFNDFHTTIQTLKSRGEYKAAWVNVSWG